MATILVHFEYLTGIREARFVEARLRGSWNAAGLQSDQWSDMAMRPFTAADGCPAFRATAEIDTSQVGRELQWGVLLRTAQGATWGITGEVDEIGSNARYRRFVVRVEGQTERYYLTFCRRLGANKHSSGGASPGIRFAVWAPNARAVELVFGEVKGGYVWSSGKGVVSTLAMKRGEEGIWSADPSTDAGLTPFSSFDHRPYMYRITKDDGSVAYRTDLYSRCQIGSGKIDPEAPGKGGSWDGRRESLDGTKSCSVVIDPERVVRPFEQFDAAGKPVFPQTDWVDVEQFWADELDPGRPLPARLEDLVIYEMHIDGLGVGRDPNDRGTLSDAIASLDFLVELGVNCVELMPFSEYEGWANWGYATSHYLAIEYAGGGRDQFKHFVKECHRRGLAVLLDVVYNHYTPNGERAEWMYDSNAHERNIYFWYEGQPSDYPAFNAATRGTGQEGHGGYIDNQSTGYAPRYHEEMVSKTFVSSAAALACEFHIDGFRVDQTTSMHAYAVIHADGRPADSARAFGAKFLRELTRTLRLLKPNLFLIAEDHSGWSAVTQSTDDGGLGFQATWYSEYYHHLIGDAQNDPSRARLLKEAGYGDNRALRMDAFAGALAAAAQGRVVYHESHDEAGNSHYSVDGREEYSARTLVVAVNGAPLVGETRRWAEARTRVAAGLTFMGPGVPMFFMGEEVGAWEPYRYSDFLEHRQDYQALRRGAGAKMFRFYQDALRLRAAKASLRSRNVDIIHTHDASRVIALRRWEGGEELLVVASFSNTPFSSYTVQSDRIPAATWREVLNSDSGDYGGWDRLNSGTISSPAGSVSLCIPANGVVVLERQAA